MKKELYIIPGWEETTRRRPYQLLRKIAQEKGYTVVFHNVNWKQPLSSQIIAVPQDAIVFGFSLGAILGWLIAQKYSCQKLILASMTPHYSFEKEDIKSALIELAGSVFVTDIIKNLTKTNLAKKQVIIYGDQEEEGADILVSKTGHELTSNYLKVLEGLL